MDLSEGLDWARGRNACVLVTIRVDGRPQTSDVSYWLEDRVFDISVTTNRAKTANLRRDPRAVVHISDPAKWSYVAFDGMVELMPVATDTDDATADALVAYYEGVTGGPHADWGEYRQAMVDDERLLVRFTPASAVGQINAA